MKPKTWARSLALITFFFMTSISSYAEDPNFGERQDLGLIAYDPINEASGIAMSRKNPNVLWTHNDSGDQARLFAFNLQGSHLGVYNIDGIVNRDWEDIAVGPGPDDNETYIYIGDIGDNSAQHDLKFIYRIPEPMVDSNQAPLDTAISLAETITFQYPDGNRDAETLMVDPLTKDIYIISKRESQVRVYLAAYPQSTTQTITLEQVATLNLTLTVGGDISPSGLEILIKTYTTMNYWCRTPEQTLSQAFENEPVTVPYISELQGEAVGWTSDQMGYYTISEEPGGIPAHLYFYPRLITSVANNEENISSLPLTQNYPNPFNPVTKIRFFLSNTSNVTLKIYDVLGHHIETLVDNRITAGQHEVEWNATGIASGVYLYQLQTDRFIESKKLLVLK
ncbi:MAG: T9SS type A sorting domain-containing protein [Caldithrix sp.]|nr:MAG: T9SS type A sorting domain-containing protein [Caldithrix sp.]